LKNEICTRSFEGLGNPRDLGYTQAGTSGKLGLSNGEPCDSRAFTNRNRPRIEAAFAGLAGKFGVRHSHRLGHQCGIAVAAGKVFEPVDLRSLNTVLAKHLAKKLNDRLELLGDDLIGTGLEQVLGIGGISRADDDPKRRVQLSGDRNDLMCRRRVVVGDDDDLRFVYANMPEQERTRGIAADDRQAFGFCLIGSGRA